MNWLSIIQTASAFGVLGILTAGTLVLKYRLKKRIHSKEAADV